jgi:hypothetical protein
MSRISSRALGRAIDTVQAMDLRQREELADEIFRVQPNLLASVIVQKEFGVCLEKMDFLINILLVCFQAMKVSGLTWATITEDEQDLQMQRYVAFFDSSVSKDDRHRDQVMCRYIEGHPEKSLVAYVASETTRWLQQVVPEESDKYVMLAAWNLINCIAFAQLAKE